MNKNNQDFVFNYHSARLQFGLFLANLNDAIKEGDGNRLFRCLKIALLFFYKYKHTKYAYAVLLFICKVTSILSEYEVFHYLHNRFYNHKGCKGANIPLDLRMEQLNLTCKTSLRAVGSNFTKNSAERISKSVSFMEKVIESVDTECGDTKRKGNHGTTDSKDMIQSIVTDLQNKKVFELQPGREGHPSFPNFNANLLDGFRYTDFFAWAKGHFKEWKSIYETVDKE